MHRRDCDCPVWNRGDGSLDMSSRRSCVVADGKPLCSPVVYIVVGSSLDVDSHRFDRGSEVYRILDGCFRHGLRLDGLSTERRRYDSLVVFGSFRSVIVPRQHVVFNLLHGIGVGLLHGSVVCVPLLFGFI